MLTEKKCFKCGVLQDIKEFYVHPQMGDGRLNKCKSCTKADVRKHREMNIDSIRQYDRNRGNRQDYAYVVQYRSQYPLKAVAHRKVRNALRTGKLLKQPCEACGVEKSEAHHDDYSMPLSVRWLCSVHHHKWHAENGQAKNANALLDAA